VQSVNITTKVVSSNPVDGDMFSMQHYVIKLVSDLRQVGGFLRIHLYLFWFFLLPGYVSDFLQGLLKNKDRKLPYIFNSSLSYIDNVLSLLSSVHKIMQWFLL
jgi:hypothetical protein